MSSSRRVSQVVMPPQPVVEGAGVHLGRSIGTRRLDHLDPFLLLDHFESVEPADYRAGFPYHPHRVRKGEVRHRDSLGHQGSIGAGDIQWMTSGSGILHEEMPQVRPEGIAGLQLWLNLPAGEKMSRPKYRDLQGAQLPEVEAAEGARLRVIAGEAAGGHRGPVEGLAVAPKFVDVTLPPGTAFREPVAQGHTVFAYLDHGDVDFGPERKAVHGPALVIARYGPFVMNTQAEIEQTLEDLRSGRFIREEPADR
jgi:redox-sensitive bicupin YhaK (pirin superfamily)